MSRKMTIGILIAVTLFLIGWDVWVYFSPGEGDTISEVLLFFSTHPILPFSFGVLMGHFFWPQIKRIVE